jgi:hypothetical protein
MPHNKIFSLFFGEERSRNNCGICISHKISYETISVLLTFKAVMNTATSCTRHRRMTRKFWFANALFLFESYALGLKIYSARLFPARLCVLHEGKSYTEERTFWKQFLTPDNFEIPQSVSQGQRTIQVYFWKNILGPVAFWNILLFMKDLKR